MTTNINIYCENKSKKPVITKYDPSKNYMVQMVDSLSSVDYPNENHIYVIESTGEKYIFYNGAFSKFESSYMPPFEVNFTGEFTGESNGIYESKYASSLTFDKTYDEIKEAMEKGFPIRLNGEHEPNVDISSSSVMFTWFNVMKVGDYTYLYMYDVRLPNTGTTGTGTNVIVRMNDLLPDSALSSTSVKPVQNRVVKQAIDSISALANPLEVTATVTNITDISNEVAFGKRSDSVTYSKLYSEIKNAIDNGRPIILTYDGYNYLVMATEESGQITMSAFRDYIYGDGKPAYRTESFIIKSDNTGQYIRTGLSIGAVGNIYGELLAVEQRVNDIPTMTITGDITSLTGTVSIKTGITDDTTYVLYKWGNLKGISPLITMTYEDDSYDTVTKRYIRINGEMWEYDKDVNEVKYSSNLFKVRVNSANTLYPNRNKTLFIGGTNDTALLHLEITDEYLNEYNIKTIKGDISEGSIIPTEGATNFLAIPIDGKNITLRNISTSNVSLNANDIVGNWILTGKY